MSLVVICFAICTNNISNEVFGIHYVLVFLDTTFLIALETDTV